MYVLILSRVQCNWGGMRIIYVRLAFSMGGLSPDAHASPEGSLEFFHFWTGSSSGHLKMRVTDKHGVAVRESTPNRALRLEKPERSRTKKRKNMYFLSLNVRLDA